MRKTIFIKNAVILTASSLILRFAGIVFKVWLAGAVGAEGIGLYQLVFSVYTLAAAFTASGVCTAVTRLVADELALGCRGGIVKIMRRCVSAVLFIAAVSVAVLLLGADFIAGRLLQDMRAAPAIRILSLSLPFMGVSSCFKGYFIARRKASPTATSQLFEQAVRILVVLLLVSHTKDMGLEYSCAAVLLGDTIAELCCLLYLCVRYSFDKKRLAALSGRKTPPYDIAKAIRHIALPITSGRYLNSLLRTAENLLVPICLTSSAGENALSQFGMIKGMALPILFFPSTLLGALSTLLIPEMSEAKTRGRMGLVRSAAERIIRITSLCAFIFASLFLLCGNEIGYLFYKSETVGFLLCALSPIVPLMYLDSVCDGILKGLDQQKFTFRTSLTDSAIRIGLVAVILPRFGLYGFIGIMYFSNALTCLLNVSRLTRVCGAKIDLIKTVFMPITAALTITLLFRTFLNLLPSMPIPVYTVALCIFSITAYVVFLFGYGSVSIEEIADLRG